MKNKKEPTQKEMSASGGKSTLRKYGKSHFSDMAKRGRANIRAKYGDDYFKKLAAKGLEARKRKKEKERTDNILDSIAKVLTQ